MNTRLTIDQIECAVAEYFGVRNNIIVPNVSWGFFATHEADMVIINKTGYLTEVEIKRSWQDFLADFRKTTTHDEGKVMYKYFAVPYELREKVRAYLAECNRMDWGVVSYTESGEAFIHYHPSNFGRSDKSKKLSLEERFEIARLGCMRVWRLKKKLTDKINGKEE